MDLIDSLAEAAVMYDEKECIDKLTIITGRKPVLYTRYTDAFAVTHVNDIICIDIRGTDGSSVWQKAAVWLSNLFDSKPDATGRHPGFREAAEWIMSVLKDQYNIKDKKFSRVIVSCHSRGTGIGVILVPILAEYLGKLINIKAHIRINAFAPVPGYNKVGMQTIWNEAHTKYGVTGTLITNPRDMATTICRGDKWKDGADIEAGVVRLVLPPDSFIQKLFKCINGVHEHRPREYADGMVIHFKKSPEKVERMKKYRKMFVN
jgi:hypothetical protein